MQGTRQQGGQDAASHGIVGVEMDALAIRFLFVTGKGGVGKTTVAAALGFALAKQGRKTLVVAGSGTAQLGRILEQKITTTPVAVAPFLYAAVIDAEQAMREYVESAVGSRLVADAVFHEKFSKGFLYGIPGLRAWALLGKAWYFSTSERGGPPLPHAPFDTVILDAPATGDSTDLLRVPRIITELAPFGRLKKDAEDCWQMLRDSTRSAIVPVTLPEELPVTETQELVAVVRDDLALPLGPLVVNQSSLPVLSAQARQKLAHLDPSLADFSLPNTAEGAEPAVRSVLLSGQRRALRENREQEQLDRLSRLGLQICRVPRLPLPPQGISGMSEVALHIGPSFGL